MRILSIKHKWTYLTILMLGLFFSMDALDAVADDTLFVQGSRINVRTGPGLDFPVLTQLENGFSLILKKREVLFSEKERFDITDDIIRLYDERAQTSGPNETK